MFIMAQVALMLSRYNFSLFQSLSWLQMRGVSILFVERGDGQRSPWQWVLPLAKLWGHTCDLITNGSCTRTTFSSLGRTCWWVHYIVITAQSYQEQGKSSCHGTCMNKDGRLLGLRVRLHWGSSRLCIIRAGQRILQHMLAMMDAEAAAIKCFFLLHSSC